MVNRPGSLLLFVCLAAGSICLMAGGAFAQISFPGQYPGIQLPGQQIPGQGPYPQGGSSSPFPGRRRNTTNNQAPLTTINGILRRISDDNLVVEADDKRIITLQLGITTKYYKASGAMMRSADLQPGDHMNIDATQDDNGYYHAKNVTQVKVGTSEERAAASAPIDGSPIVGNGNSGGGNPDSDDDRPRLHRSPGSDTAQNAPVTPQITRGDSSDSQTASRAPAPPVPPTPSAPPALPDPNDPGPPKIRRGVPPPSNSPPLIAQTDPSPASRPSIHADEVNGVTRTPDAPLIDTNGGSAGGGGERRIFPSSGDPVIDKAREAAFSFSETLPNYVVKQFTTRYETEAARGGQTSWRALDNVSADVVSEGGKESYKNILVNGKPPREAVEKTGSWSTGEYSSVQLDVLSTGTRADFHNKRSTTIANRAAWRYDFSVEQPNSHWHVYTSSESYNPEYTGGIWIDKDSSRVLRIELAARNMPRTFSLDTVESSVDYDYVLIGDARFLLPVHSEALTCERGTSICSRNTIDFRNYKKFSADTNITFDSPDK
jgi:hypothetical protein